jgi:hypothetical protein
MALASTPIVPKLLQFAAARPPREKNADSGFFELARLELLYILYSYTFPPRAPIGGAELVAGAFRRGVKPFGDARGPAIPPSVESSTPTPRARPPLAAEFFDKLRCQKLVRSAVAADT